MMPVHNCTMHCAAFACSKRQCPRNVEQNSYHALSSVSPKWNRIALFTASCSGYFYHAADICDCLHENPDYTYHVLSLNFAMLSGTSRITIEILTSFTALLLHILASGQCYWRIHESYFNPKSRRWLNAGILCCYHVHIKTCFFKRHRPDDVTQFDRPIEKHFIR